MEDCKVYDEVFEKIEMKGTISLIDREDSWVRSSMRMCKWSIIVAQKNFSSVVHNRNLIVTVLS